MQQGMLAWAKTAACWCWLKTGRSDGDCLFPCSEDSDGESSWKKKDAERKKEIERKLKEDAER